MIKAFLARSNLLTRLLLLVFVATLPAFAVLLSFQWQLRDDRLGRARMEALRQADLIHADVANMVENARELLTVLVHSDRVREAQQSCGRRLQDIQHDLAQLVFIAVLDDTGHTSCSSTNLLPPAADLARLAADAIAGKGFVVGRYTPGLDGGPAVLGMAMPLWGGSGQAVGVIATGLNLDWLGEHLLSLKLPLSSTVTVADRWGTALARFPDHAAWVGRDFRPQFKYLVTEDAPGTTEISVDGRDRVIGYIPAKDGIYVGAGFYVDELTAGLNKAAERGYLFVALGFVAALLLALFVGERFVRAPTAALLASARKWGSGDLSARTKVSAGAKSEFGSLATAFNAMAETLEIQQFELKTLNGALESRVRERTHALLESNNRLQVEIAERELTEADLRQAQKLQALGQLAGGIAHDFNNLLAAVLGSLELMRQRRDGVSVRDLRLIDIALQSVQRGVRLTAQLLAFSRKQRLLPVSVDLGRAVRSISTLLETTLGSTIRIDMRLDPSAWPVMADPNQLETALLNLGLNARDAMPSGGRLTIVSTNISIGPDEAGPDLAPGDYVALTVTDSGIGMTEAVRVRAVEPFFTTKAIGQGSGLGLSQVHGMVLQLGGDLQIASRPGDGTRVTLLLARASQPPLLTEGPPTSEVRSLIAPTEAILLIDDDDDVREVTCAMLQDSGLAVVSASDGAAGLEALEREGDRIRLVIADYAMPGMTGLEVLQTVHARRPGLPVLIATGYADFGLIVGEGWRTDLVLRKPFRTRDLLAKVEWALEAEGTSARQVGAEIQAG